MMEIFGQGTGKASRPQRRVDIGRGRLIAPGERNLAEIGEQPLQRETSHRRLLVVLTVVAALFATSLLAGCAGGPRMKAAQAIEIESVRVTAAGHYIDLRYRVLDPVRANDSLGPGVKPVLIDERTGATMAVPMTAKLGSLRQTRGVQRPDRSYFVLFANTAGVRAGSRVTAEIGDMTFENLTIE